MTRIATILPMTLAIACAETPAITGQHDAVAGAPAMGSDAQPDVHVAGDDHAEATGATCPAPTLLRLAEVVDGRLDDRDCTGADGTFQEAHVVFVDEDTVLGVSMAADGFVPWVQLHDMDGRIVAETLPGDGEADAWMEIRVVAGAYTVVATTQDPGDTGTYRVAVSDLCHPVAEEVGGLTELEPLGEITELHEADGPPDDPGMPGACIGLLLEGLEELTIVE